MSRTSVVVRDAVLADVPALVELWEPVLRRGDDAQQQRDVAKVLADVAVDPARRVIVAECDGQVAGAAHLLVTTVSSLNLEPIVQVLSPHVHPDHRRRGVGTALLEAATVFAEERGVPLMASAAFAGSRDANRFLARLGLAPQALLRAAPVHVVRHHLAMRRVASTRPVGSRPLTQVLAARRSLRRAQQS